MLNIQRHQFYRTFCKQSSRSWRSKWTYARLHALTWPWKLYGSTTNVISSILKRDSCLYPSSRSVLNGLTSLAGNTDLTCTSCVGRRAWMSNSKQKLSFKEKCQLNQEWKAFNSLLSRSAIFSSSTFSQLGLGNIRWFSNGGGRRPQKQDDPDRNEEKDPDDEDDKTPFVARMIWFLLWFGFLLLVSLKLQFGENSNRYKFVSWNEFVHDMLAKGEVEEIIVQPEQELAFIILAPGAVVKDRKVDVDFFTLKIVDSGKIEDKIRKAEQELGIRPEQGVPISYKREGSWSVLKLLFMASLVLVPFLLFRNVFKQMPNVTDMFASARKAKFVRVDQQTQPGKGITFKDVAGLTEAKVEVMEFVDYLKRPQRYTELGGRIPCGALLLGPPGCGKTLLAKAVANEAEVPFLAMAGSEFVEMIGGLGAARVRDLFKEARQKSPCIIYIDEIDAIGRQRGYDNWAGTGEEEQTLNQLLVEMDGMDTTKGVIMLASTNREDVLDKALLRPGRFDRHILIDFPTLADRKEIFEIYLGKLALVGPVKTYSDRLAQLSPGMSGADIANICNEAALYAARFQKKAIDKEDFDYAVERVIAGVAKKSRILSPQEKKIVAYHEAGHALVGWQMEHTDALLKVSIVPRTNAALGFAQYMPSDRKLFSKEELFERMCMALGGRVAESLTFNAVTTGAQDDLKKVTDMAYNQIGVWGMNDKLGHMSFPTDSTSVFAGKPYSKKLASLIDHEARTLVAKAYKHTEALLQQNKTKLQVIAEALLEKEALSYVDMEQLVGPPPYGKKKMITLDWESQSGSTEAK